VSVCSRKTPGLRIRRAAMRLARAIKSFSSMPCPKKSVADLRSHGKPFKENRVARDLEA
jgi:hypothetical protein